MVSATHKYDMHCARPFSFVTNDRWQRHAYFLTIYYLTCRPVLLLILAQGQWGSTGGGSFCQILNQTTSGRTGTRAAEQSAIFTTPGPPPVARGRCNLGKMTLGSVSLGACAESWDPTRTPLAKVSSTAKVQCSVTTHSLHNLSHTTYKAMQYHSRQPDGLQELRRSLQRCIPNLSPSLQVVGHMG